MVSMSISSPMKWYTSVWKNGVSYSRTTIVKFSSAVHAPLATTGVGPTTQKSLKSVV